MKSKTAYAATSCVYQYSRVTGPVLAHYVRVRSYKFYYENNIEHIISIIPQL